MLNKLKRLIGLILPFGLVWLYQKKLLKKRRLGNVSSFLRRMQPGNLDRILAGEGLTETSALRRCTFFLPVDEQKELLAEWRRCSELCALVRTFFSLIRPHKPAAADLVRIGGAGDGGYIMIDPGHGGGIAYSFGVSSYSPWDLEMAERGFTVFQYDGTVAGNPHPHPNIFFSRHNIDASPNPKPGTKNLCEILRDNGHEQAEDMVLQIDIEGAEWDLFEYAGSDELRRFSQIIVELHELDPMDPGFARKLAILGKLRETHTPVHVHANNVAPSAWFLPGMPGFASLMEVSYARNSGSFLPSGESFPTRLDRPNAPGNPEILIGVFGEEEGAARYTGAL